MVLKARPGPGGHLHGCLRSFVWLAAVLWCIALSAPLTAEAVEYNPPSLPFSEPPFGVTLGEILGAPAAKTCPSGSGGETTRTEEYTSQTSRSVQTICRLIGEGNERLGKRLFWVVEEVIKDREKLETVLTKIETLHTDLVNVKSVQEITNVSLSTGGVLYGRLGELLKSLGTEGQLHKDLTVSGGLPVKGSVFISESGKPVLVSDEMVAENVDASGEALQGGLWFLAGLVVCACVAAALWRTAGNHG